MSVPAIRAFLLRTSARTCREEKKSGWKQKMEATHGLLLRNGRMEAN